MDRDEILSYNERNIAEFRASGGRIASFGDAPMLLLTTTGARTGAERTSPLMYLPDANDPDRVYVFASAAGAEHDPAWFKNLVAEPEVGVEIGAERLRATAEVLPEPRRAAVYSAQAELRPQFAEYQEKTARKIPVISLALRR